MNNDKFEARIAVINFSGNVGKTTITTNLLRPRMNDSQIFSIETINSGANGDDVEIMKGKKYGELIDSIFEIDSAIVDIGSSNVEDFMKLMKQYDESHDVFDYFIIPVIKEKKAQIDTINTIRSLNGLGVPKHKILTVFNKIDVDDKIEEEFIPLMLLSEEEELFTFAPKAVIHENEIYDLLKSERFGLSELRDDQIDYRKKLKELTDSEERNSCVKMMKLKMLARTANKNLDTVFAELFT